MATTSIDSWGSNRLLAHKLWYMARRVFLSFGVEQRDLTNLSPPGKKQEQQP